MNPAPHRFRVLDGHVAVEVGEERARRRRRCLVCGQLFFPWYEDANAERAGMVSRRCKCCVGQMELGL